MHDNSGYGEFVLARSRGYGYTLVARIRMVRGRGLAWSTRDLFPSPSRKLAMS